MDRDNYICDDDRFWAGEVVETIPIKAMKCNPGRVFMHDNVGIGKKMRKSNDRHTGQLEKVMKYFAIHGKFAEIIELMNKGYPIGNETISACMRHSNLMETDEIKFLIQFIKPMPERNIYWLDYKEVLHVKGSYKSNPILVAIKYGNLAGVKLTIGSYRQPILIGIAIYYNQVEIFDFLIKKKCECDHSFCTMAAYVANNDYFWGKIKKCSLYDQEKRFLIINYGIMIDDSWINIYVQHLVETNNMRILRHFQKHLTSFTSNGIIMGTIERQNLGMLKILSRLFVRAHRYGYVSQALGQNLPIVKYLLKKCKDVDLNECVKTNIVKADILEYLYAQKLITQACIFAGMVKNRNLKKAKKYYSPEIMHVDVYNYGDGELLRWMYENDLEKIDIPRCFNFKLSVLRWLYSQRPFDVKPLIDHALGHSRVDILEWIKEEEFEFSANRAFRLASRENAAPSMLWLMENYKISYIKKGSVPFFIEKRVMEHNIPIYDVI